MTDKPSNLAATEQSSPARIDVLATAGFADYALLDSGAGRKLERFGEVVVDRPEPQALWQPRLKKADWAKAHAVFSASGDDDEKGRWRIDKPVPNSWPVKIPCCGASDAHSASAPIAGASVAQSASARGVTMLCRLQGLWHLGLFPEQLPHWHWMLERITDIHAKTGEPARVLNLFGYTGAASLLAAAAGAHVTHVDASKKSIAWGRENQAASKLTDKPIRWLVDDAAKFVARDIRRAKTYHIILVDPPKFGRGPEGETWDLFEHLPGFLRSCVALLDPEHAAMVLTVYAIRASTLSFGQLAREALADRPGSFETGELVIRETLGNRVVPTSLYTRWVSS